MGIVDYFSLYAGTDAFVAIPIAFLGGVISAFNPCCLPMIPTVVVLVGNQGVLNKVQGSLIAALFVIGFSLTTALMGAVTVSLGVIFGQVSNIFLYLVALIPILMALQLLGVIHLKIPAIKSQNYSGHWGALLTGMVFALVVVPCATPIFASILAYAISRQSVLFGSTLLWVYGLGLGVPLVIMGSFMGLLGALEKFNVYRKKINTLTAVALLGVGIYLVWTTSQ